MGYYCTDTAATLSTIPTGEWASSGTTCFAFSFPSNTIADILTWCWIDCKGRIDLYPKEKSLPNGACRGKLRFNPNLRLKQNLRFKPEFFDRRTRMGFEGVHGYFKS